MKRMIFISIAICMLLILSACGERLAKNQIKIVNETEQDIYIIVVSLTDNFDKNEDHYFIFFGEEAEEAADEYDDLPSNILLGGKNPIKHNEHYIIEFDIPVKSIIGISILEEDLTMYEIAGVSMPKDRTYTFSINDKTEQADSKTIQGSIYRANAKQDIKAELDKQAFLALGWWRIPESMGGADYGYAHPDRLTAERLAKFINRDATGTTYEIRGLGNFEVVSLVKGEDGAVATIRGEHHSIKKIGSIATVHLGDFQFEIEDAE